MTTYDVSGLKALLETPKKIVITTHRKPDGDAMGSSLALANYLQSKGHDVTVAVPTNYPDNLKWMAGNDDVLIYNKSNLDVITKAYDEADISFCLDLSVAKQMPNIYPIFEKSAAVKILIDHHNGPEIEADHTFWDPSAAATAEIIYQVIDAMGDREAISPDAADCLYVGLMTDTGRFKHPNTTVDVFNTAAALCELGANNALVSQKIYDNASINGLQFLGFVLSQRLVILEEYNTAYLHISPKDFAEYGTNSNDTEDLVYYALSLKGIRFAVLMTDLGSKVKLSFRSLGDFSVSDFATKHFDGGGHTNASGGSSYVSLDETRTTFEGLLPLYKEALTS